MRAAITACALAIGAIACSSHAPAGSDDGAARPRLVVLVVVDQWPEWAFVQKLPAFRGGFARAVHEGTWLVGEHPSIATLTAPGHALLGTGATPDISGIMANEWWHRDLGKELYADADTDGTTTTRWLRVPGLGDALAAAGHGGKAIAVSLKARAALLPLGHAGTAIWYDAKQVGWASSTPLPWLDAWNASHPIAAHLHDVWTPLDPARLATLVDGPDDAPGEFGDKGMGATFPHALAGRADAIIAAPIGNELVLDTATQAITAEQLGADDVPDLLVVSLSAHDYVGHAWGQESWEMWDLELRLDARLGQLMTDLDRLVGADRWAMILTSDHGASPLPDRHGGGRLVFAELRARANAAAATVLGAGEWVAEAHYPTIDLTAAALALPADRRAAAIDAIVTAIAALPGVAFAAPSASLEGNCDARAHDAQAICRALDPERSGQIVYLPAANWVTEDAGEHVATAHGSLNAYDREVPLILLPAGHAHGPGHGVAPTPAPGSVSMARIAPTLARWLGIPPPRAATAAPL